MATVPAPDSKYSAEEWAVRIDLAACYRLASHFRMTELIHTHISAPGSGHPRSIPDKPLRLWFHEVTASNLVKIDIQGEKAEDSPHPVNPAGFIIHAAIHDGREDAHV